MANEKYDEERKAFLKAVAGLAGKEISATEYEWAEADASGRAFGVLTLKFSDDSELRLASYDYEGYSSGLELWDLLEAKERESWLSVDEKERKS